MQKINKKVQLTDQQVHSKGSNIVKNTKTMLLGFSNDVCNNIQIFFYTNYAPTQRNVALSLQL